MRKFFSRLLTTCTLAVLGGALLPNGEATAVEFIRDSSDKIVAIVGLEVQGQLYMVRFADGDCATLFDGCDDNTDFAYDVSTLDFGRAAAPALLEVVKSLPPHSLLGCEHHAICDTQVPINVGFMETVQRQVVGLQTVRNFAENPKDTLREGGLGIERTSADAPTANWAIITPLPGCGCGN